MRNLVYEPPKNTRYNIHWFGVMLIFPNWCSSYIPPWPVHFSINFILCFHSRGQRLCKFIGTKESVYIRKEFNSHRTGLGHKHGRRFIVLGHKYGRHDVMWKHTIAYFECKTLTIYCIHYLNLNNPCISLVSISVGTTVIPTQNVWNTYAKALWKYA